MPPLPRPFYARPARAVAADLLGKRLVRVVDEGRRAGGIIVEAEAYCDGDLPNLVDLACHGSRNAGRPTARTAVMFGPAGHAYVYFTYGMHWLFNVVTGVPGAPNAVLVRAIEPDESQDAMAARRIDRAGRPLPRARWTDGPAKLTAALDIDGAHHGLDLCAVGSEIWIEPALDIDPADIATGPRVGLGTTPEPWLSLPWRYWIRGNPFVSRGRLTRPPASVSL